jgi:hypothetical protein
VLPLTVMARNPPTIIYFLLYAFKCADKGLLDERYPVIPICRSDQSQEAVQLILVHPTSAKEHRVNISMLQFELFT